MLGPLLFVIFINDLEDSVEGLLDILRKFGDDTKLGQEVTSEEGRTGTGCRRLWMSYASGLRDGECSLTSPKLCIWGPATPGISTR